MVESIIQPHPIEGKLDMSITAIMKQSKVFGPSLELRRTISGKIGEPVIRIKDVVTNYGNTPTPHMVLYHCNFGWPLIDEGTDIVYKGRCESRGMNMDNKLFNDKHNYRKCREPLDIHKGTGESCGFIDVIADKQGVCTVGLHNRRLNMALVIKYKKKQLASLTNWQHWGPGEYVCAIEPGTNPPIGQAQARKQKKLIHIAPGKSKTYNLEFTVLTNRKQISKFIQTAG